MEFERLKLITKFKKEEEGETINIDYRYVHSLNTHPIYSSTINICSDPAVH